VICPVSGHRMVKRFGRNGWFLGCSAYPECKHTMPLEEDGQAEALPEMPGVGEVCPQCGEGHLVARRGRFGPFVGCDRYPECRYIKKDAAAPAERFGPCPKCGIGTVVTKRARRGRRPFWGCERYPDCDYSTWTRPSTVAPTPSTDGAGADGADQPATGQAAAAPGRRRAAGAPRGAAVGDGRGG